MTENPLPPKSKSDEVNTTGVIEDLFTTLRRYSQASKVTEADILRQRARLYASTEGTAETTADMMTILVFTSGGEQYGVDVMRVREVRPLRSVTRVPNAPSFYSGVMNVRGTVMTLLDLPAFLGSSTSQTAEHNELVVLSSGDLVLGTATLRVLGVLDVPPGKIRMLDDARYAVGVYHGAFGNTVILDVEEIFRDERLTINQEGD